MESKSSRIVTKNYKGEDQGNGNVYNHHHNRPHRTMQCIRPMCTMKRLHTEISWTGELGKDGRRSQEMVSQ